MSKQGSPPPADAVEPGISRKLNKLFEVMHNPSEAPLSNAAAAKAITETTGVSISSAYLWQLRSGVKTNPTVQHLRAIAQFFGVPPTYLVEEEGDPRIDAQLALLQAMRDAGVRDIALRASGLTPKVLNTLAAIIDHARELEDLPPLGPNDASG